MMAATQVQLVVSHVSAAPLDYVVPSSLEAVPLVASAVYDGTAAAGPWLPAVEIYSDSGNLVARSIVDTAVAAGSSAEVTFAPFLRPGGGAANPTVVNDRGDLILLGWGVFTETTDFEGCTGTRNSASGRVWYLPFPLAAGDVLTGVTTYHVTAGASVSLYRLGVYATDGSSLLATTGNRSADALAQGWRPMPLSAPLTAPADGRYYLGVIVVHTSASPTWALAAAQGGNAAVGLPRVAGADDMYYTDAGPKADLPSSFSKAALGGPPATVGLMYFGGYT